MIPADLAAERQRVLAVLEGLSQAEAKYEQACMASWDDRLEDSEDEIEADRRVSAWLDELGQAPALAQSYAEALGELERVREALEHLEVGLQMAANEAPHVEVLPAMLKFLRAALAPAPEERHE